MLMCAMSVPFSEMQKGKQSRRAGDIENQTLSGCFTGRTFGFCHISSTNPQKVRWGKRKDFLFMESQEMMGDTEEDTLKYFQLLKSYFLS